MSKRETITAATVAGVAAQNAGHPLEHDRAERYAQALEPLLQVIADLRELPLKNVEPACVFHPETADRND